MLHAMASERARYNLVNWTTTTMQIIPGMLDAIFSGSLDPGSTSISPTQNIGRTWLDFEQQRLLIVDTDTWNKKIKQAINYYKLFYHYYGIILCLLI